MSKLCQRIDLHGVTRHKYGMLSCDKIQVPAPGPFTHEALTWYGKQAWIPKTRLTDFLKGEECRPKFNTSLKIKETVVRNEGIGLVTIRYWCCYGPKDARGDERKELPEARILENGEVPLRQTTKTGASFQRGCQFHFTANFKELERPEACLLRFVEFNHVDKKKGKCHGWEDKSAWKVNAHIAPRISIELRETIERLLRTGVSKLGVLKQQREELRVHRQNFKNDRAKVVWTRDMGLSLKDIQTVQDSINKRSNCWASDDALGLKLWVEANGCQVLLYQERDEKLGKPFLFVFGTQWQMEKMATLGHGGPVSMDATFGVNEYEYSLYTMLCFDEFLNGIPTCWALMETHKEGDLIQVLKSVKEAMARTREYDLGLEKTWTPSCFIVDCAAEEQNALSTIWQGLPITLCTWHVRRAWTKNILKKVRDPIARARMNSELGDLMYGKDKDAVIESLQFILSWREAEPVFVNYYETYWHPKITRWCVNFRKFDRARQNTNGAIERWHHTLKFHLRQEKACKAGRKVVWLVEQLVDKLEHYYWCMSCMKWQGRVRNRKIEDVIWKAIKKCRSIPDSDVKYEEGGNVAYVRSQKKPEEWHVVEGYEGDSCVCTCGSSVEGNTCKHQIKLLRMGGMEESTILELYGTKFGTMVAGMAFERPEWPEEEVDMQEGNVTLPFVEKGEEENLQQETDDAWPICDEALREEEPKSYNYQHYEKVLKEIWQKVENIPHLNSIGMVRILELRDDISNLHARHSSVQIGPRSILHSSDQSSFKPVPGANGSLKRKESFVDKMWKRVRPRPNAKKSDGNEDPSPTVFVAPFVKTVTVKESDQHKLDKEALKCVDLNEEPNWQFTATMGKAKKNTKKVSTRKPKKAPPKDKPVNTQERVPKTQKDYVGTIPSVMTQVSSSSIALGNGTSLVSSSSIDLGDQTSFLSNVYSGWLSQGNKDHQSTIIGGLQATLLEQFKDSLL